MMTARARVSGCFGSRTVAGLVLTAAAVSSGVLLGGAVGGLGALLDPATRRLLVGAAVLGLLLGTARHAVPWQLDRETDRGWLAYEDWRTAAYNGLALGAGFHTRVGFWVLYLLPAAALAGADPLLGAAGWALYALVRVGGSLLLTGIGRPVDGGILRARAAVDLLACGGLGWLLAAVALNR